MNKFYFISVFIVSVLASDSTNAQQNYSANSALDCNAGDETGPSPAFLYTCNGQNSTCQAFLIFKSQPPYDSVPTISTLLSANQEALASINNVTRLAEFPANKEVIVPINCSCLGEYYQANTTFQVTTKQGTYYVIANDTYEGLSTCASLMRANAYGQYDLFLDAVLQVPLRCACPTANQTMSGVKYLLTYPVSWDDNISDVAVRFHVSEKSIFDANGMEESADIYQDTTILIPLSSQPMSSQTIIRSNPPETSSSSPPASIAGQGRSKRKWYEYTGIGASCSLLVLGITLAIVLMFCKKRRNKVCGRGNGKKRELPEDLRDEIASFEQALTVYRIEEVKKATNNFDSKHRIKGSVYRGDFGDEILAVKAMSRDVSEEVKILKTLNHFNLIKLHGVSENYGCYYLVFEYMKNGCLREWLSNKRLDGDGNWAKRMQIAIDVANGLHYLHNFTDPAHVHKDIKSSNVLLNGDLRAKIANFSLASAAARETADVALTNHVVGTRGYMAPEYLEAGQVSPKIDVYAFGVVLLELITGKEAVFIQNGKKALLSTTILSMVENENAEAELALFVDPSLKGGHGTEFSFRLARVGMACLAKQPARRPSMEEVVSTLLKIQADLQRSESLHIVSSGETVALWCPPMCENTCRAEAI